MSKVFKYSFLMATMAMILAIGCKKKDSIPATVSTLTTTALMNITASTATSGGTITGNGGADITASGVAWSRTNSMPTIADDTTMGTTASGSFVSELKNLDPSATYYVRAYATNSVGTGYGNVLTFVTGNAGPVVTNLAITGNANVGAELTASYTYSDAENDAQSGTTFQWYIASDVSGSSETAIAGANTNKYIIKQADEFKYIRVGVTPKAATGTASGAEVKSTFAGPIQPETVTFTYNGQQVTYGVITSSKTGRKWLDRNLGAQKAADSVRDYKAYGDLFQWGRLADGHQLITWVKNINPGAGTAVNGVTANLSSTDVPGHSNFILAGSSPNDWRDPRNLTLWRAPNYVNNPCPSGWHIPTSTEWEDEHLETDFATGRSLNILTNELKLTSNGNRRHNTGVISGVGQNIQYWSSDIFQAGSFFPSTYKASVDISQPNNPPIALPWQLITPEPASANPCRCIKNN